MNAAMLCYTVFSAYILIWRGGSDRNVWKNKCFLLIILASTLQFRYIFYTLHWDDKDLIHDKCTYLR